MEPTTEQVELKATADLEPATEQVELRATADLEVTTEELRADQQVLLMWMSWTQRS